MVAAAVTKPRTPHSWPDAVTRIAGRLGYDGAARAVAKSERLVRAWSDPDSNKRPSLDQALALSAAYAADGGEDAPFVDAFACQLDIVVAQRTACTRALTSEIAEAAREGGEAVAASLALIASNASPRDAMRAFAEVQQAEGRFAALGRRLASFLPIGAGPGAGNTGGPQ